MKDFGDKSLHPIDDANSTNGSPIRVSNQNNSFDQSNSFTSSFSVAMSVMATSTIYMEEQLAKMARVIAKLTKTIKEKDLQIDSFVNKIETQVQNTVESSQGLTLLLGITSPRNAPPMSKSVQVGRQTVEFASVALLSVQQLQDMITNIIIA